MSNIYPEVVSRFSKDRVLEKFDTPQNTLPYTLDDIKISHNEYLLNHVYNDVIFKLHTNFLFLIANAEIYTSDSPTLGVKSLQLNESLTSNFQTINTTVTGTKTLSTVNDVFFIQSPNSTDNIVFNYGTDKSYIFKTNSDYTSMSGILSGNEIEFGRDFKFNNVVSVDRSGDFLFVLDKGNNTIFKLDISGILYNDPAIQRTGLDDNKHPGRYLVKTVGGKGKINRKNKLTNPESLKVYNDEVFVLDNGNLSIKVYDLNFNFKRDLVDKELFLNGDDIPVSITVDSESDLSLQSKIFILTKHGSIVTFSTDFSNKEIYKPYGLYSSQLDSVYVEQKNFKKIIFSPRERNVIYVVTNKRIIKFYKTNLSTPIGAFDFELNEVNLEKINSADFTSISAVDNLALFTSLSSGETKITFYKDQTIQEKLYHTNFYNNCYTFNDIKIDPQELVNSITFNKTTEKIIYNHSSFFENIYKKVYGRYDSTRVPKLSTVVESTFDIPASLNISNDFYVGINEPILTDVLNRTISKLYDQQVDIFNILKETYLTQNPPVNVPEVLPSKTDIGNYDLISISTIDQTVNANTPAIYNITRSISTGTRKVNIYHSLGANTVETDIKNFISSSDPLQLTFADGETELEFSVESNKFYGSTNKSVDIVLSEPDTGAVLEQTSYERTTTIQPTVPTYTISLSSGNPTSMKEGDIKNFALIRTSSDSTYLDEVSCNIYTDDITTTSDDINHITDYYTSNTIPTSYATVANDDFVSVGIDAVSAKNIHNSSSNGSVVFTSNISAVYFSMSAAKNAGDSRWETFSINVTNPSEDSTLGSITVQNVSIANLVEIELDLDSNISTYSAGLVSGANIWEVLSADSTYKSISSTHPISASLTLSDNLTVYSPSVSTGAIYFDSEGISNPLVDGSILRIVVPTTSYIIGKGGDGGDGILWYQGDSGNDISDVDYVKYRQTASPGATGQDGGMSISLSGFTSLSIDNSGYIYGGAGGGGAGNLMLAPAADFDIFETIENALSASAGGGGGAGIVPGGNGQGGTLYQSTETFVFSGVSGNATGGGAGGTIDLTVVGLDQTLFKIMSGADGGDFGESGQGGDTPGDPTRDIVYSSSEWSSLQDEFKTRFPGGSVGYIYSGTTTWSNSASDISNSTGTFSGRDVN